VPIGPLAVASVSDGDEFEAELLDEGAELEVAEVGLEVFELLPQAASSSDAATAVGMRNFF
jgi:hypothetical protein